jgi:MFS family permease
VGVARPARPPLRPLTLVVRLQLATAIGDAFLAVALARSLFFSVSLHEARPHVLLYLVVTMVPFSVLAPVVGPLLDRLPRGRKAVVAGACALRAVLCILLARDLQSLLLYPEAFGALMCSKANTVTVKSLVPELIDPSPDGSLPLVRANSRIVRVALVGSAVGAPVGAGVAALAGAAWALRLDALIYLAASALALRLPPLGVPEVDGSDRRDARAQAARDGEHRRDGGLWRVWHRVAWLALGGDVGFRPGYDEADRVLLGTGAAAVGVVRASVGYSTFLLLFVLKGHQSSTAFYGLEVAASGAGAFLGSLGAPRLRRRAGELATLAIALALPIPFAIADAAGLALAGSVLVAFAVGLATGAARVGFDSLVQHHAPTTETGRAFARFETRFQVLWVVGAIVAALAEPGLVAGMALLAALSVAGLVVVWRRPQAGPGRPTGAFGAPG